MEGPKFTMRLSGASWTLPVRPAAAAPAERFRILRSGVGATPGCHPVEVLCWDDFLPTSVRDELFAAISDDTRCSYAPSKVWHAPEGDKHVAEGYRRSLVLQDQQARDVLLPRLAGPRQVALERAGYGNVPLGTTEVQVTASGDGDHFGVHTDDGTDGGPHFLRLVTFVYYLHRQPRPFSGGALRVYDSRLSSGGWGPAATWIDVDPVDNRLVMFLSDRYHEVLRVDCESDRLADRRFTVNGWFSSERDLRELGDGGAWG